VEYDKFTETLVCDEKLTSLAEKAALKVTGSGKMVAPMRPMMISEDFSEYTGLVPCTFAALGGGGRYPQHSAHFAID
jgi:metal-dependent amidase/aminoacylase/carboxypeptidase family protein